MICAACKEQGLQSTIHGHGSIVTAMAYNTFYDADGILHQHDSNTFTETWRCSNGHLTVVTTRRGCPNAHICGYTAWREERLA